MKKKVFVGMSGGVDSSVSALLLKQQGYEVTGVFIKVWQPDFIECTWKEDRLDAMRVAALLDIPFITLDLEQEYKKGVIDYMIEEYRNGRTPNPDVMCNKEVKFGAFYIWAKQHGVDYIATGHYACHNGESLTVSKDINKDQTYFLWTLKKELLPYILFPIGHMNKIDVRILAQKNNLSVSTKKDSQGLCFVGTIDIKTLLKNYMTEQHGDVIDELGNVIGNHSGATFFTLGERHGFTITEKEVGKKPYFIIAKDINKNIITVSHTPPVEQKGEVIALHSTNWTVVLQKGEIYDARARYRANLSKVEIIDETHMKIIDGELIKTPGQSLVLYKENLCVGGGIIC